MLAQRPVQWDSDLQIQITAEVMQINVLAFLLTYIILTAKIVHLLHKY